MSELWLRAWRQRAGLSQDELAEAAGVTQHTVSEGESGRRKTYPSTLRKLAAAIGEELGETVRVADLYEDPSAPLPKDGDPSEQGLDEETPTDEGEELGVLVIGERVFRERVLSSETPYEDLPTEELASAFRRMQEQYRFLKRRLENPALREELRAALERERRTLQGEMVDAFDALGVRRDLKLVVVEEGPEASIVETPATGKKPDGTGSEAEAG